MNFFSGDAKIKNASFSLICEKFFNSSKSDFKTKIFTSSTNKGTSPKNLTNSK